MISNFLTAYLAREKKGIPLFGTPIDFNERATDLLDDFYACKGNRTQVDMDHLWAECFGRGYESMLMRSLYDFQLEIWVKHFPISNFCFIDRVSCRLGFT